MISAELRGRRTTTRAIFKNGYDLDTVWHDLIPFAPSCWQAYGAILTMRTITKPIMSGCFKATVYTTDFPELLIYIPATRNFTRDNFTVIRPTLHCTNITVMIFGRYTRRNELKKPVKDPRINE